MPEQRDEVVKVQLPLSSTESEPEALIYNKSRSLMQTFPVEHVADIMKGRPKAFFEASWIDGGDLILFEEVEDPGW